MNTSNYPITRRALWRRDVFMVFAFFAWAVVLGLLPVLALGALIST
jgi:hypothetical protein